ncbi:MAG: DUF983 domain-containing protein [Sphingomonas sp.]|jgi:uncharacterized protein (DUF983 family)|uniref:DUF983 domain-containing protein n=1 Tax=Sphingomonas sp. TaxID=28214 RepID=UPI0035614DEE
MADIVAPVGPVLRRQSPTISRRLRSLLPARRFGSLLAPRTIWIALWRGCRDRCPACDGAPLFYKFLKPLDYCPACGQDWTHQNADDFPPYIVILVTGHVVVTGMASLEAAFHPPSWVHIALWIPLIIILAIGLIQPAKGGVIAYQWWHGMGGFGERQPLKIQKPVSKASMSLPGVEYHRRRTVRSRQRVKRTGTR